MTRSTMSTRLPARPAMLLTVAGTLAAALALSGCGSATSSTSAATAAVPTTAMPDKSAMPDTSAMPDKSAMPDAMAKGAYVSYADYQASMAMYAGSKVVLFFHAPWCPDCRATDTALTGTGVPDGLVVVKVDYDTSTELKQRFGITQQHTFVQLDKAGAAAKKWTGSKDGAAIKAQTV
jgi:thioredoxin 1